MPPPQFFLKDRPQFGGFLWMFPAHLFNVLPELDRVAGFAFNEMSYVRIPRRFAGHRFDQLLKGEPVQGVAQLLHRVASGEVPSGKFSGVEGFGDSRLGMAEI